MHVSVLKCHLQFISKAGTTDLRWMGAWHASGTEKTKTETKNSEMEQKEWYRLME